MTPGENPCYGLAMMRCLVSGGMLCACVCVAGRAQAQPSPDAEPVEVLAANRERDAYLDRSTAANSVIAGWSAASIATGAVLFAASEDELVRGMAVQHMLWGGIDAVIAGIGMIVVSQQQHERADLATWQDRRQTAATVFWVNAVLDLAYIATGTGIWLFADDPAWRGTGAGIVTQGAFLLGFDATAGVVMGP